jgi:hypothetical protein
MSALLKDSGEGTSQFPLWKFYSIHFNIIRQSFSPHTQAVETRQVQICVVDCRNTHNGTCIMEYCLHISMNISTFTTPRNIVLILVDIVHENLTEILCLLTSNSCYPYHFHETQAPKFLVQHLSSNPISNLLATNQHCFRFSWQFLTALHSQRLLIRYNFTAVCKFAHC